MADAPRPRARQVKATAAVVRWYLDTHYGGGEDPGRAGMYCDPQKVGAFAVDPLDLAAGKPAALFRVLIATTLFQRRQDQQVLRILRGIPHRQVAELASARRLLVLADACACPNTRSIELLNDVCDLTKLAGQGICSFNSNVPCQMKRHSVLLKRYGHFGKVPTSVALALREAGARDLEHLRVQIFRAYNSPFERATELEAVLKRAWRVSDKIAAMFLSVVSNQDLSPGLAPWSEGLDWTRFVVIDSNVDLFLSSIRYRGPRSYEARRAFLQALSKRIDLAAFRGDLCSYNPRLVQQAMYVFMSRSNRVAMKRDCAHQGAAACRSCPRELASRCAVSRFE